MYLNYIFLLTDFYKNDFIPDSFESLSVIVPMNQQLWENKKRYVQKLNAGSFSFCFGFFNADMDWGNMELSLVRDAASLFFFLSNYIKKGGAYLLVSDLEGAKERTCLNDIENLLKAQGIAPLSKNYINVENRLLEVNDVCYYNPEIIAAFNREPSSLDFSVLFKKITADNSAHKQIVLPVKDEEDFKRTKCIIRDFEQWLLNYEAAYADLLAAFKKVNSAYSGLDVENKKLRFRLDNYNDYLKLLRDLANLHVNEYRRIHQEQQTLLQRYGVSPPVNNSVNIPPPLYASDEALQKELEYLKSNRDNILSWYQKEYEVLPLWYKRFGHLIKAMMGKRSFKSLFK